MHGWKEIWRWELFCGLVVPHGSPEAESEHLDIGCVAKENADWRLLIQGLYQRVIEAIDDKHQTVAPENKKRI